jgi:hypothetical protein
MDNSIVSGPLALFGVAAAVLLLVSVFGLVVSACLWPKAPSASLWAAGGFAMTLFVLPLTHLRQQKAT